MSSAVPVPTRIRFGAFELDPASGELRKSGILVKLQPQAFRVLLLLIEREGQVVTRDEIQRYLWSDSTFVDFEHAINFSINQIRRALADNAEEPRYVETLTKRGYRFIGTVEESSIRKQSAALDVIPDARHQSKKEVLVYPQRLRESVESPTPPAGHNKSSRRVLAISAGAAVVVLAGVVLGIQFWKSNRRALNLERLRWTPDGAGVDYFLTNQGVSNIWRQPVPKGSPHQITNFTYGHIFSFDWSSDGKQLYVARGPISSDIVQLTNFR